VRVIANRFTSISLPLFVIIAGLEVLPAPQAAAQTFNILYSFTGSNDGGVPLAGLIMDSAGNLYGTASNGGASGAGVVFKVTPGGQQEVLYTFTGAADGGQPEAALVMDSSGNLYGTTYSGGSAGLGTVFELSTTGHERVLHSFVGGADGSNPIAGLVMNSVGVFFGTTYSGGVYSGGTVFEVTKGGRERVLHSFGQGTDGASPIAGLTFNPKQSGVLFGTTAAGGTAGEGTIFRLVPFNKRWQEKVLYSFQLGNDGGAPYAGVLFDQSGHLYGAATTGGGGGDNGGGTVFEMTHSQTGWNFQVLYDIPGWGLSGTFRNLMLDASGNIFATTHCDGAYSMGTIYELSPSGSSWNYNSLYVFPGDGSSGYYVFSDLIADSQGNLYGTASDGGAYGSGVVFQITP
jgi:uncharacterized repeat protein (TIGR03803 family)